MTAKDLHKAEAAYRAAVGRAEAKRLERNRVIRQAVNEGWRPVDIAREFGWTRARITQIVKASNQ